MAEQNTTSTVWMVIEVKNRMKTLVVILTAFSMLGCQPPKPDLRAITEFYDAIRRQDPGQVKHYLDSYQDMAKWEFNMGMEFNSVMASAMFGDNVEITKMLVERGGAINYSDKRTRSTPLLAAVQNKHSKVLKYLVESGADVNLKDADGLTVAHQLALSFTKESADVLGPVIHNLLEDKAKNGATPLYIAVAKRNSEAVKWFLGQGLQSDELIASNWDLMSQLIGANQNEILVELLNALKDPLVLKNKAGQTLLHVAGALGNSEIISELAKHMNDVNTVDDDGNTAIQFAVGHGEVATIGDLVKVGVKPEHMNKNGRTALEIYRAQTKSVDSAIIKLLGGRTKA